MFGAARPKMPFAGAESALSGVAGEGAAMFSPAPAYGPNTGECNGPTRPTGSGITIGKLLTGFSSKKVPKGTRLVPKWAVSV
jgi:hypothetical protein